MTLRILQGGEGAMLYALSHEISHYIREWNPGSFKELADFLIEQYGENGIDVEQLLEEQIGKLKEQYQAEDKALPSEAKLRDEAYEELVADAMSEMLADDAAYEKLAKLKSQNKTLWEKIGEAIRAMLDKIKGALGIYKEADSALPAEARAVRELSSDVYTKLQDLYVKAFVEADENYSGSSNTKYSKRLLVQSEIVDLTDDNDLSNLIDGIHGASRYKLIAKYIMDVLGNESIVLSDGKKAIVDRRDSTHIAAKAGKEKTAQISKIKEIIKKAKLYAEDKSAIHNKFSQFSYYRSIVEYNGDKYPIYVNVGLTHNDKTYHIYDITHKIRDTANRINGFEQPKINEGYALKNDISIDSIQESTNFVNSENQNSEKNLSTGSYTKFSLRGSSGNDLSEAQQKFFENSKVRDDDGNLLVVYHGSPSVFTEFSHKYMSQHGSAEGQGFYFTDKKSMAEGYKKDGGQLLEGYLNIEKPLSDSEVTLKRSEVKKLIETIDPTGDDILVNYDPLGGMGYPSKAWYTRALNATVDQVMKFCDSDSEILADIANSGAGTKTVVSNIRQLFGYDGYIVKDKYAGANVYVAFESNQFKNKDNKMPTNNSDIRYSLRKPYSYEALVSKPDMRIITLDATVPSNRADVVQLAKKNAASIGTINKDGSVSVHVNDINIDVILGTKGLRHGLDRRFSVNAPATLKIGEILQNSIRINEMIPSQEAASESYALIGASQNKDGQLYIVRSVVNRYNNELDSIDTLYAINAKTQIGDMKKRNQPGDNPQGTQLDSRYLSDSTISIAQLLEYVNKYFPDILPESVLRHYGYDARPKGELGESALYSTRQTAMKEIRERLQANQVDTDKIIELADKYYKDTGGHMSKSRMRYKFLAIADQIMSDYDAAFEDIEALAEEIVNDPIPPSDIADTLKEIRAHVRTVPLWITDHDKGEFGRYGGYNEFRKENMGRLRLTNYGFSPDSLYIELQGQYGKTYFPDVNTVAEMVIQIADVVNSDPLDHIDQFLYDDYYNADDNYEFKVSSIANDLTEIIADSWKRGGLDFTELNLLKESDLQSDGKLSDRELLANALESAARSDSEKNMLSQYKKKIRRMSEEQKVLDNTKKVIKELSFQKGKRDTARIGTLKELVSKTENRINTYDRQLLRLESTSVLSEIIKRERQKAYEKANQVDMDNFEKTT